MSNFLKKNKLKSHGYSLLEVVISLFFIAVALVVYVSSLNLVRNLKNAKYQNLAYHLATRQVEDLRNTDFASLPATGSMADPELSLLPSGAGTLTVTDIDPTLKQVNVTISWSEGGTTKLVVLDTMIYKNGINSL